MTPHIITAKERAARRQWRGLGDVIASATKAIGIRPCAGCRARQQTLNRLVPFSTKRPAAPISPSTTSRP